jgi:regulatory protein
VSPPRSGPEEKRSRRTVARIDRASLRDADVVMDAAAAFLAVRPRSIAETGRRLRHLGYPAALVETVLARLAEMRYLDDEAFARSWVESRDRARPRGAIALRRELALRGVARDIIDRVLLERAEPDPSAGAGARQVADGPPQDADRAAAERLLTRGRAAIDREPDPRKRRQKAYALLARNGFDPETCRDVSALVGAENPEDDDR